MQPKKYNNFNTCAYFGSYENIVTETSAINKHSSLPKLNQAFDFDGIQNTTKPHPAS